MSAITCGCGGASGRPAGGWTASNEARGDTPAPAPSASPTHHVTTGRIDRAILDAVLDGGFGRFLQGVETEPVLDAGRFVGFRLRSFYPRDTRFSAIDLVPGDTVLRVNGQAIERPEQALAVWNGLRVASELMVEYVREGEPRELRFVIQN